jgi:hypothetical protein
MPDVGGLQDILELSTFLEIDIARLFAIQALANPKLNLSPCVRLSLAIRFRISDWIEPAFDELIATPANRIPHEDFMLIGMDVGHLILATQAAIRAHRLLVAYNPLKIANHDPSCEKPVVGCQCNWEAAWWHGLARHYLHPEHPSSPTEMIAKLEKTPLTGVTTACRLKAVQVIKEQRVFEAEDDMRAEAFRRLREYEGTCL